MMIPNELVIITNFVTITNLNMRNTFSGLILPSITSVFYIYLLKENFEQVPDELYRAAKVDGTSDLKYLLRVLMPICRPTLITVTILKIIECWNSYVWPRLITDDPNYYLVSNGIQEIRENGFGRENIPAMMAAVVVISAPLIVLFLIFSKQGHGWRFQRGLKGMKNIEKSYRLPLPHPHFCCFQAATGQRRQKALQSRTNSILPGPEITFWAKNDTDKTQTDIIKSHLRF